MCGHEWVKEMSLGSIDEKLSAIFLPNQLCGSGAKLQQVGFTLSWQITAGLLLLSEENSQFIIGLSSPKWKEVDLSTPVKLVEDSYRTPRFLPFSKGSTGLRSLPLSGVLSNTRTAPSPLFAKMNKTHPPFLTRHPQFPSSGSGEKNRSSGVVSSAWLNDPLSDWGFSRLNVAVTVARKYQHPRCAAYQ